MTAVGVRSSAEMANLGSNLYTTRKTEAHPKQSLFGSSLEMRDGKEVLAIDASSVPKTPPVRGPGQRYELPPDVKKSLPAAQVLERSKQKFDSQRVVLSKASENLRKKEEDILYSITKTSLEESPSARERAARKPQWLSEKDLIGSEEINAIGLNKNQSYNRDKYGQQPQVHNYSLIGDILKPGMDFPRRERTDIQMRNLGYGKGDVRMMLEAGNQPPVRQSPTARSARPSPKAAIDLPPNIRHQFGSRVCDSLLADKKVVDKTIQERESRRASMQRKSQPFSVPKFSKELNPDYEMLGNSLRMNVVPGYSTDNQVSTTKTEFNDQVHLFRHQDPDKWRYQKDELSTWTEQIFLHNKLIRSWQNFLSNAPKFSRNWEQGQVTRTKTAPAAVTANQQPKKQRPRPKPKTAPKQEPEDKPAFEDVVFETPPVTPPPEKVQIVRKKDDDFWNFYEGGGK